MDIFAHLEQQNIRLTDQQRAAVQADAPAVLLLAVPGAGKTTTLAARAAWLLATGRCAPEQMLNLTFNRDAAADMQRRFDRLFGGVWGPQQQPRFSTIHSFCWRLLHQYAASRGTRPPQLVTEAQQRALVLSAYRSQSDDYLSEERLDQLLGAVGFCTNMMYTDQQCAAVEREISGLRAVRLAYRDYKLQNSLMDFDDMLAYALQVLRRQPSRVRQLRARCPYLQLDEAQDTSLLQHSILETLDPPHLFFVGDEDQSIYGFRGAFPEALLQFDRRHPGGLVLKMEENFRSSAGIVQAAEGFIAGNRQRYAKTMTTARPQGAAPQLQSLPGPDRQYDWAAGQLADLPAGQTAAVLYRGGISGAAMADALLRRGVPFALRARRYPLLQDPVARDVMALLRLGLDPGDTQAFLQVYYKLGCYIGRDTAQAVQQAQPADLWQWLADEAEYPGKSTARLRFLQSFFKGMGRKTPPHIIDRIVYDLEYIDKIQQKGESGYTDEAAAQKLGVLRSIAGGCADLAAFADRLAALDGLIDAAADPEAAVTLSTVHSAKGREFDQVFLIDLLDGVFPASQAVEANAAGDDRLLEEEARMFYVAVTRARSRLTLLTGQEFCGYQLLESRFVPRVMGQGPGRAAGEAAAFAALGVRRGTRLSHRTYGFGTVEELNPARAMFSVRFGKLGVKTFAAASLEDPSIFRVL